MDGLCDECLRGIVRAAWIKSTRGADYRPNAFLIERNEKKKCPFDGSHKKSRKRERATSIKIKTIMIHSSRLAC